MATYCRKLIPYVSIYLGCACCAVPRTALVRNQVFWYMTLLFFKPTTFEYESNGLQNKYTNYKGIKNNTILDKLLEYKRNWIQYVNRIPRNRLPRVMKHYSPTGRRNYGRPLKRILDTWDRNGSTSGPTPWQIHDDDDDDDVPSKRRVHNPKHDVISEKTRILFFKIHLKSL